MTGDWSGLFERALEMLARKSPGVQFLALMIALVVFALMLQGIGAAIPKRKPMAAPAPPVPKMHTAWSPPPAKRQPVFNHKREVAMPTQIAPLRPAIRRTGQPGYMLDDTNSGDG